MYLDLKILRAGLVSLVGLGFAGCSLAPPSTSHLQISMPAGGFTAGLMRGTPPPPSSVPNPDFSGSVSQNGGGGNGGGGPSYPVPTQLSDFVCAAVIVTAPDIRPDPLFSQACGPQDLNGNPINVGAFGGFVAASGGTIDIVVQNGAARNFQLIGVQYTGGPCPSAADILQQHQSKQGSSGGGQGYNLGDPYVIASVTQDISGDQSIELTPSFTPGADPAFKCGADHDGGGGNDGPIAFGTLDFFPHLPSSGTSIRVIGDFASGDGMVNLYTDSSCTGTPLPSGMSRVGNGQTSAWVLSATVAPVSQAAYYIQAANGSQVSPCTPVPGAGFQYVASLTPSIQITSPYPGQVLDGAAASSGVAVSGTCSPAYGGEVYLYVNGIETQDCGQCGGAGFTCPVAGNAAEIAGLADGAPFQLVAQMVETTSLVASDDGFLLYKDSQAPGVMITSPSQGATLSAGMINAVNISGTCGAPGLYMSLSYYAISGGNNASTLLSDNVFCNAGSFSYVADLSAAPIGMLGIMASFVGPAGPQHTSYSSIGVTNPAP